MKKGASVMRLSLFIYNGYAGKEALVAPYVRPIQGFFQGLLQMGSLR